MPENSKFYSGTGSMEISCAYLYIISKYGYPPPVEDTVAHIREIAQLGFASLELEAIGKSNIEYLFENRKAVKDALAEYGCSVPVLCVVLPRLGADLPASERAECLELFEIGCQTAHFLGAEGVLDNGPLLPLKYPSDMPVMRHYSGLQMAGLHLPFSLDWNSYWNKLAKTYGSACGIAAKYGLDYHLHPCEGSLTATTDSFLLFSQAVNAPNLKFNLDTSNQFLVSDSLALSLVRLRDKISYIHISDNSGLKTEHLPPGKGNIDWDLFFAVLREINYKGRIAIDVGGAETGIENMEDAYRETASWLNKKIEYYLQPAGAVL
ncbi:Sugar phosphate isomerase/epimerase [Dyadobacter koreensis]|uniref:Sugar phosphate isomerase/epimerase n=2 Tax=Dyadobacter koreensis TaxID=408657 RepID=A0A1H6QQM7_9BACT|nr:Sugar phosphate isomerase/epimerase [Dyadobacter koreensis]